MRAVSFFGPGEDEEIPRADGGEAVAEDGGSGVGRNTGGDATGLLGAGGKGDCASGGRGGRVPTVSGGRRAVPLPGGRAGILIRTVSRRLVPVAGGWPAARGGKVIRTVSFFGSFWSAIRGLLVQPKNTGNFTGCHWLTHRNREIRPLFRVLWATAPALDLLGLAFASHSEAATGAWTA